MLVGEHEAAALRAGAAKEALNQRLSETDLTQTKAAKERAIELVGDELEKIVQGMAPRCALCGGTFAAKDKLLIQGMVKFHVQCMTGAAAPTSGDCGTLTVRQAVRSAPATLILKLVCGKGKVMTFFLSRDDEREPAEDTVTYVPDTNARAPTTRRAPADLQLGAELRAVSDSGADLAHASAEIKSATLFRGILDWESAGLQWSLTCDWTHDNNASSGTGTLTITSARLQISPVDVAAPPTGPTWGASSS